MVNLKIEGAETLADLSSNLQSVITQLVTEKLGIENLKSVDVNVSTIKAEKMAKATPVAAIEESLEVTSEDEDDNLIV